MKKYITNKLIELEKSENIRILYAAESGSRAWGFASPDSDYDVRFIYVRPLEEYLRINERRDTIELPITKENGIETDISGWDIKKALRLAAGSNPSIIEWLSSDIVYRSLFTREEKSLLLSFFNVKKIAYHYLSMAKSNGGIFLSGDMVKCKKYLYVIRALLSCEYVLSEMKPAPLRFDELCASKLPPNLKDITEKLLEMKLGGSETACTEHIPPLDDHISEKISVLSVEAAEHNCSKEKDITPLNKMLFEIIMKDR